MTKLEIIEDTIKYYSEDVSRRSITINNRCVYKGPDCKECAFQRVVVDDLSIYDGEYILSSAKSIIEGNPAIVFKPGYEGHEAGFWNSIQALHDRGYYWDKNGLTTTGLLEVEALKEIYKNK